MNTKLILASILFMSQAYELFAMNSNSKELVQPINTTKQKSPVALLLEKIKEKNRSEDPRFCCHFWDEDLYTVKPEFSRFCCCPWKKNVDALNLSVAIEQEIKCSGISSNDSFLLYNYLNVSERNECTEATCSIAAALMLTVLPLAIPTRTGSPKDPLQVSISLAVSTLSCLTCTAALKGYVAASKSPYLRNVLKEYEKNRTCPGKIEMVYSPNKTQETLSLVDAQDNV